MTRSRRLMTVASAALVLGIAAADLPEGNAGRLRSMSRDQRLALVAKLAEFDALSREERDAVRDLHGKLAELDPETRARYLNVMRRYEVFRQGLPEAKRQALDAETDPARRLALIASLRAERKAEAADPWPFADALQISDLARMRLRALAGELVVWFSLDPKEDAKARAEYGRASDPAKRKAIAANLIRQKGLRAKVREEDDEFLEIKGRDRKEIQALVEEHAKADEPKRKRPLGGNGVGDPTEKGLRNALARLDEIRVIHQLDDQAVSARNLARFEAALPPWARESLDALPPDAARRRLKALYRLVFPDGSEIPEPAPATPSAKAPPASGSSAGPPP